MHVRDVYRTFDVDTAPVRALRGADLDVAAGEFVAITGPSGCGKSTLLSIIAGLEVPDDGVVEVAGHVRQRARDRTSGRSCGATRSASCSSSSTCSSR